MKRSLILQASRGLTLLELVVTLVLLAALGALIIPSFSGATDQSRIKITTANLNSLYSVIMNRYRLEMSNIDVLSDAPTDEEKAITSLGFPGPFASKRLPPDRGLSPQLLFLFVNPTDIDDVANTYTNRSTYDVLKNRGWNGPYLSSTGAKFPDVREGSDAFQRGFRSTYGVLGDPTVIDGWGHPIVLVLDESKSLWMLASAGLDEVLNTSDDMVVYLQ